MEIECKDNLPYSVEFKENYQIFCKYIPLASEFAEECKSVALNVWKALGGVDAGRVDVKADRNGRMCFMEVNPLAGLHPVHSDLPILSNMIGINYQALIEMIMKSAIKRHHLTVLQKKDVVFFTISPGKELCLMNLMYLIRLNISS
jgi:D-alanine-D-alanine ligase